MHDGAPPHSALTARACLDEHSPGCWVGRRGPREWPPRSPDLTPCDFYLWGYTKEVYKAKPCPLEELETLIQEVLNDISDDTLQKVVHSIPSDLRKLVDATDTFLEI